MSKTYAVADLHGRRDLLNSAIAAICAHSGGAGTIVFLGDYIDRGPASRQVIERLIAGPDDGMKWVCLQGNHEQMMLVTVAKTVAPGWWIGNGGDATLRSYGSAGLLVEHVKWVLRLPVIHSDAHRIFVHAGVAVGITIAEQDDELTTWFRCARDADYHHPEGHVVHGHTAFVDGPVLLSGRTNLDTLAWKTGRLVVGVFDDDVAGGPVDLLEVLGAPA